MKKTLLLANWVTGEPTRRIETSFHCFSGSVSGLSVEYAWLAETLGALAKVLDWPEHAVENLSALSRQLIFGVPAPGVKLASTRVKGSGPGRIVALIRADLTELEKIISAPIETLAKIVTRPVADRLQKRAAELLERVKASKERGRGSLNEVTGEPPERRTPPEWPKEYPPSDPVGASYLSDARIHLDGRARKRRHLATINDAGDLADREVVRRGAETCSCRTGDVVGMARLRSTGVHRHLPSGDP